MPDDPQDKERVFVSSYDRDISDVPPSRPSDFSLTSPATGHSTPVNSVVLSQHDRDLLLECERSHLASALRWQAAGSILGLAYAGASIFRRPHAFPNNTFLFRWAFKLPKSLTVFHENSNSRIGLGDRIDLKRRIWWRQVVFGKVKVMVLALFIPSLVRTFGTFGSSVNKYMKFESNAENPSALRQVQQLTSQIEHQYFIEKLHLKFSKVQKIAQLNLDTFGRIPNGLLINLFATKFQINHANGKEMEDFDDDPWMKELYDKADPSIKTASHKSAMILSRMTTAAFPTESSTSRLNGA